jgi:hypothetical protein
LGSIVGPGAKRYIRGMWQASRKVLREGRSVFRAYGSDWSKVYQAGQMNEDGVVVLPSALPGDNAEDRTSAKPPSE